MQSQFVWAKLFFCFFFLGGIGACASKSVNKDAQDSNLQLTEEEKARLNEYKMETELGRSMAGYLLQFYGTYDDDEVVNYVNSVGNYVASRSEAPDRNFMFEILNSDAVNAFACPGGYIMLTLGAVRLAESEAELAMILGHEVAHVEKQHMFKTLIAKSKEKEAARQEARAKLPFTIRNRERIQSKSSALSSNLSRYVAGQGIGFSVLSAVKSGVNVAMQTGVGFENEFEADSLGLDYAIRAGYKPNAFPEYLGRLRSKKASIDTGNLDKTHPTLEDREQRLIARLKTTQNLNGVGAEGKERFYKMKRRLLQKQRAKQKDTL